MKIFKNIKTNKHPYDDNVQLRSNRTLMFEGWGNLFFAILGLFFFLLGTGTLKFENLTFNNNTKNVLLTLGVTFLSNSIYNYIRSWFVLKDENILFSKAVTLFSQLKLQKDYGLVNIFNKNDEVVNEIVTEFDKICQNPNDYHDGIFCDIICNGNVAGFIGESELNNKKDHILSYLRKGLSIRVIISNPNLKYLAQLYVDSKSPLEIKESDTLFTSAYTETKKSIEELIGTFDEIMKQANALKKVDGRIDIKFTNCIPAFQYYRIGNKVFVSSRMLGSEYILNPIVHEYEKTNRQEDAFQLYEDFFNSLWKNPIFSWYDRNLSINSGGDLPIGPNYIINPRLVIGDVIINKIMRMTCNTLVMILRTVERIEQGAQPVRAFFTVINCTDPVNEDKVILRYNVHAVDRDDSLTIPHIPSLNNYIRGKALGYEVNLHHAIGEAVITEKIVFRTVKQKYEPSDINTQSQWGKAVVSLSVPINANVDGDGPLIQYCIGNRTDKDFKICSKNTKTIATITFEFHETIKKLFGIQDVIKENEVFYFDDKKDKYRRIIHAAKECTELIIDYLGLDASVGLLPESNYSTPPEKDLPLWKKVINAFSPNQ